MNVPYKRIKHSVTIIAVVIALIAVVFLDRIGAPQKWHAAVYGTVVSFSTVISLYHHKWTHWQFWVSVGVCFAAHLFAVWYVLEKVWPMKTMGILMWIPLMFPETILVYGLVPVLERALRSKKHPRLVP